MLKILLCFSLLLSLPSSLTLSAEQANDTQQQFENDDQHLVNRSQIYKENISALSNSDTVGILTLTPKKYNFIGESSNEYGFVAEDVEIKIPDAVFYFDEEVDGYIESFLFTAGIHQLQLLKQKVDAAIDENNNATINDLTVAGNASFNGLSASSGTALGIDSSNNLILLSASSETTKKRIQTLDAHETAQVFELEPCKFEYERDRNGTQVYGLIAENLIKKGILKNVVRYGKNKEVISIDYTSIFIAMLDQFIRLKREYEEDKENMQKELKKLRKRLFKLEKALEVTA